MTAETPLFDLFVIGGGINGCGIARDAAGRGLKVGLAEMNDLASATSSASTKLFHGGLRYLEYFEFRLVREALAERETLLAMSPHISWPLRFVLPHAPDMRFEAETPASRLVSAFMPWMKGRRPAWMIRLGLFLYDHLGGRRILPGTRSLDLAKDPAGAPLKPGICRGWEYSDCWVQDSRLVVLNARDAAARGAEIMTRARVVSAERSGGEWRLSIEGEDGRREARARALVNAAGPWAGALLGETIHGGGGGRLRLVRGSHVVTRRLFDHDRAYILQGPDGRVVFAIPYEEDFTLIGTTDEDHPSPDAPPVCTDAEKRYLLDFVSRYFRRPATEADVVWTYSGVRPLYDDGASSATAATRDYVLKLDAEGGAPLLSVFGGKITTYRRLAEAALARLGPVIGCEAPPWTAGEPLPGGDFPVTGFEALVEEIRRDRPFLDAAQARRLARTYGTEARALLDGAETAADLGEDFGAGVTARELDWAVDREWVRTGEDFLWRRTRLGLRVDEAQAARIDAYVSDRSSARALQRA